MKNQPCTSHVHLHISTTIHTAIIILLLFRVATIIRSYFNDTILSQLGDIENYIASYIYDNVDQLSIEIARVACGKPCSLL